MGYDIHCYAEVLNENGVWHAYGKSATRLNENYTAIPVYNRLFITRNRALFATLSGIHAEKNEPVMFPTPRGLPYDLSNELRVTFDSIVEEIHTNNENSDFDFSKKNLDKTLASYVTYAELKMFVEDHPSAQQSIDCLTQNVSEELMFGAEYDAHRYIRWGTIDLNRKRLVFFYDW